MSKTIRLSEEAYERLAAHKEEGETFSDTVLRVAGERSILELRGLFDDEERAEEFAERVEATNERVREEVDETIRELEAAREQ